MDLVGEFERLLAFVPLRQNHQPAYREMAEAIVGHLKTFDPEVLSERLICDARPAAP